ncbi:MAG: DNA-binding response regulator [uncultured Sulfurovum sp.]|uniref:DNA-binding response regulator n=1 Tax=uncultured Sulfurovum sp. TaxID=269237 RepID=A0A6S6U8I5_9BACT|nr:MAG: DNA-binding response regulator [uncultured Sulfurovum sp.]
MNLMTKTILLAEDEDEIREDLAFFLEYQDYNVLQARDGQEAYQCYLDNVVDLIITDIEMPRLNGLEFVANIRKEDQETPILIISGYSDKDKLLRAIKLNLVDYIIKPFTQKGIMKTVADIFLKQEADKKKEDKEVFSIKSYSFNFTSHLVSVEQKEYTLTHKQSEVLKLFVNNVNVVLSPIDIYYYLYPNYDKEYSNASIRNIIKRLRVIFPEGVIESIYSEGYRFNIDKL